MRITLTGVDRIKVVRGPSGSLYGSNSVGGTVNFQTRAPSRDEMAEFGLQGSHLGDYWMNDANTVRYDGHDLLSLRLDYRIHDWTAWEKGESITDERFAEIASSTYSGLGVWQPERQDTYTPCAPRTWTVGFSRRFGGS